MGRCSKALGGTITLINAMESNAATMILLHLEKYTFWILLHLEKYTFWIYCFCHYITPLNLFHHKSERNCLWTSKNLGCMQIYKFCKNVERQICKQRVKEFWKNLKKMQNDGNGQISEGGKINTSPTPHYGAKNSVTVMIQIAAPSHIGDCESGPLAGF